MERAKAELIEDMVHDPPVSRASRDQMCAAFSDRDLAAIIITVPFDQLDEMLQTGRFSGNLAFSDDLDLETLRQMLVGVTSQLFKDPATNDGDPKTTRAR